MLHPSRWRSKPVEVDAVRVGEGNDTEVLVWVINSGGDGYVGNRGLFIRTPDAYHIVHDGQWVVRHANGAFHVASDDAFRAGHEPTVSAALGEP